MDIRQSSVLGLINNHSHYRVRLWKNANLLK